MAIDKYLKQKRKQKMLETLVKQIYLIKVLHKHNNNVEMTCHRTLVRLRASILVLRCKRLWKKSLKNYGATTLNR